MSVLSNIKILPSDLYIDSAYWGLGGLKDDGVYLAFCTHHPGESAAFFKYYAKQGKIEKLFTVDQYVNTSRNSVTQGKIHTPIFEGSDGLLYFGTHFAYPYGIPQPIQYEGGHLLSYNPRKKVATDLGIASAKEGILTIYLDNANQLIYLLTAPSFEFIVYDIKEKIFHNFGRITKNGSICRTLVNDIDGNIYGSYEENNIFKFDLKKFTLEYLDTKIPNGGKKIQEWSSESRGGVNHIGRNIWRCAVLDQKNNIIYGIHSGTSRLFAYNPNNGSIEELEFMGADRDIDNIDRIYPTLSLSQYNNLLFYTPASGFFDYSRSENIEDFSHLISYDITTRKKKDHGLIKDKLGRRVYGVAGSFLNSGGHYYLLGAVEVLGSEVYNKQNILQQKPFHLALIEININKLF